jgi:AraC-like DNA-binding protein
VLPPITHLRATDRAASRLAAILTLLGDEANADRPGRSLVVARLLELMLVEAIRFDGAPIGTARPGLLAGLADMRLAAPLRALHGDIKHGWTVAMLAELSGLSRSVFAERFGRIVGQPPIEYLLHWRVALAKEALRFGGKRPVEIAFDCGYQSYSAFSTAFRRVVGCSPGQWAANTAPSCSSSTASSGAG